MAAGYIRDKTWGEVVPGVRLWNGRKPDWTELTPAASHDRWALEQTSRAIAEWLLDEHPHHPLRDHVTTAPAWLDSTTLPALGTRATNVVHRELRGRDLGALTPAGISALRNVGRRTAIELVCAIVQASVHVRDDSPDWSWSSFSSFPAAVADYREGRAVVRRPAAQETDDERDEYSRVPSGAGTYEAPGGYSSVRDPRQETLLEDILAVARWQLTRGDGLEPLLSCLADDPVPAEVGDAQERLLSLRAIDLLDSAEVPDAVKDLDATLSLLDDRGLLIVRERFFALEPRTLDELGRSLGLTRERVRQLESKAISQLREATEFGGPAGDFLAVLRAEIKSVVPLSDLTTKHPNLLNEVPTVQRPLWFVLDRIDDAFEVEDGWAAAPTVREAKVKTEKALEDLDNRYGLVRLEDLQERLGHKMSFSDLSEWVEHCGYTVIDKFVLIRNAIPDRAVAALALEERPMSSAEICARIPDRSPTSVKNALAADDRVHRIGRDAWALVDWGHETYSSIRDMIGRVLDRSETDRVRLTELTDELSSRFDVSPNSVLAYASSPPFSVSAGWVERASEERSARKAPGETRRLYRAGQDWRYRVEVTDDHLRGSGFPVPRGVVDLVNCSRGEVVPLVSAHGTIALRWTGLQPSCGSIRSNLEALGARAGDVVFLRISPETLRVAVEPMQALSAASPINQLRLLCGLTAGEGTDGLVQELAAALALPAGADAVTVASAFRDRGERDLYERALEVLPMGAQHEGRTQAEVPAGAPSDSELLTLLGLG